MSTVYEAWDERIGRRVAVKTMSVIDQGDFEGQELLARFARGAQAAGQLNHRNIVQVYDYAEQDGAVYLVMEFIDGRTLKSELDSSGAMDPSQIVSLMEQVLLGLGYSHARGVVHRDMKPANILLTDKGEAKITDFGIARMERSDLTQPGMFIGTPSYMSPEQFRGDSIDYRTDIYSVGVILYQMLTARRPYEGGLATIMHKVLNTEPPPPSSFGGTALAAFDPVVRRAMAKRPQDRFGSASDFAAAIEAAADATAVRVTSAAGRPVRSAAGGPVASAAGGPVASAAGGPVRSAASRPVGAAESRPVAAAESRPVTSGASRPVPAAPTVKHPVPLRAGSDQRTPRRTRRVAAWQLYAVAGSLFAAAGAIGVVRSLSPHPPLTPPVALATLPARPAYAPALAAPPAVKTALPGDKTELADDKTRLPGDRTALPGDRTALPGGKTELAANTTALPGLPVPPVAPPALLVVPPHQEPASLRQPPERAARAPSAAPPANADSLRSVLLRLSHQLSDAPVQMGRAAVRRLPDGQAAANAMPQDQGAIDDSSLSVLWYAASSSPIGLLLQGNAPSNAPGHPRGLSVIGVVAGSPAEQAGCRAGDLILAVDDRPVTDPAVFDQLRTGRFRNGSANLRIIRHGKTKTVPIVMQSASAR